jgi:hypothetical protein
MFFAMPQFSARLKTLMPVIALELFWADSVAWLYQFASSAMRRANLSAVDARLQLFCHFILSACVCSRFGDTRRLLAHRNLPLPNIQAHRMQELSCLRSCILGIRQFHLPDQTGS